jgi:hypothetical protein
LKRADAIAIPTDPAARRQEIQRPVVNNDPKAAPVVAHPRLQQFIPVCWTIK